MVIVVLRSLILRRIMIEIITSVASVCLVLWSQKLILAKSELLDVKGFHVWMHSCESELNDKYKVKNQF